MKKLLALAAFLLSAAAHSQTTLTYKSQGFADSMWGDWLAVTITLPAPLAPNLSNASTVPKSVNLLFGALGDLATGNTSVFPNSGGLLSAFYFSTDAAGKITAWSFYIYNLLNDQGNMVTFVSSPQYDLEVIPFVQESGGRGAWTQPSTPPATVQALGCVSGTLAVPSQAQHFNVSQKINGAVTCAYLGQSPKADYLKVTSDGGKTYTSVTLASLNLGK